MDVCVCVRAQEERSDEEGQRGFKEEEEEEGEGEEEEAKLIYHMMQGRNALSLEEAGVAGDTR